MKADRYLPTLDGWRAIAIAMVLCAHVRLPGAAFAGIAAYGALGVHLFFAISGFLITYQLLGQYESDGHLHLRGFYIRRAFRILPPALTYLAAVSVMGAARMLPVDIRQVAAAALFYRNYYVVPADLGWYTAHYWSLSVEEHFYLLWPPLLAMLGLRRARWAVPAGALLFALWRGLDGQFGWIAAMDPSLRGIVWRTDYRMDGLLWGCASAFLWHSKTVRRFLETRLRGLHAAVAGLAMVLVLIFEPPGYIAILALLMPVPLLCTVAHSRGWLGRALETPALAWLGRISYSVYLWQMLFLPAYGLPVHLGAAQSLPLNLLLVFGFAAVSYYGVESPLRRVGRHLSQRAVFKPVLVAAAGQR